MSPTVDDEVKRATKLLETVMQAAGLTRKELDQRLGAGPGYISQVLTGRMELKYRHIIAILRALDVDPGAFFQSLYPEPQSASSDLGAVEELLKRLQKLGVGAGRARQEPEPQTAPGLDSRELERLVQNAVRTALAEREASPAAGDENADGAASGRRRA
ncbi:MAG TPA: helix-turn-helix transcriptional regulator [Thermoanaerobaculia bacterium]|jgi:transcriptional regulator with XRE-family HTH domain|nr:helix-turn-helix transcriptional regulator [Thermoanaerobaculia bacterium]